MTTIISMLRGVNVGGHHKIGMGVLRAIYESLGLRDPQTYIQSGNVVFQARTIPRAARIEDAIEKECDFRPSVILRTIEEMRGVIARCPYAGREPAKLAVQFLADDPAPGAAGKIAAMQCEPEEMALIGRELYMYFPNGMARPNISWAAIDKALRTPYTGRNWNTVRKLLEMAERAPAGARGPAKP